VKKKRQAKFSLQNFSQDRQNPRNLKKQNVRDKQNACSSAKQFLTFLIHCFVSTVTLQRRNLIKFIQYFGKRKYYIL